MWCSSHFLLVPTHAGKSQLFDQCQWKGICFRVHSVAYHLARRHLLFFSKEISPRAQSYGGCGIFGVGVSSSRWCSCPSLVLRHLEGNGSGTKKADCNPFGSWWEASWPAQISRNWCPSSSSVTCCWMKPCCAHRWQRGRAREVSGVCSVLCSSGEPVIACPTPWEFIQTSRAWYPPNVWLYCFHNNFSRSKNCEFDECRGEIWNMI